MNSNYKQAIGGAEMKSVRKTEREADDEQRFNKP